MRDYDGWNCGAVMAEPKIISDEFDEDVEARAIAEAEADAAVGRLISHEEIVKWLESWGKSDELPCPIPKPE